MGELLTEEMELKSLVLRPMSVIHVVRKPVKKTKYRTFEKLDDEKLAKIAKSFSKLPNNSFKRISLLGNVKRILLQFPEFEKDEVAMTILKDPILLSSMQSIETLRLLADEHPVLVAAGELISKILLEQPEMAAGGSSRQRFRTQQIQTDELTDSSSSSDNGGPSTSRDASPTSRLITTGQLSAGLALAYNSSNNSLSNIAQRAIPTTPGDSGETDSIQPSTSASHLNRITTSMFSNALSQAMITAVPSLSGQIANTSQTDMNVTEESNEMNVSETVPTITVETTAEPSYETELQQMSEMGFTDQVTNLQALRMCNGNVDAAINLLFSGWIA